MIVKNCILKKPVSCHQNDHIIREGKMLRDNSLRNIVIVDDSNYPIGIVSSIDIINKIIADGIDYKEMKAKDDRINLLESQKKELSDLVRQKSGGST